MDIVVLNRKTSLDDAYIASFKEQKIGIYARSQEAAKQKAVEYYKPKKNEKELLQVESTSGFNIKGRKP